METKATEWWQPGKVELDKIIHDFPHLVTTGHGYPPELIANVKLPASNGNNIAKFRCKWARQLEQQEIKTSLLNYGSTSQFNCSLDNLIITSPSKKQVAVVFGHTGQSSTQAQLPMSHYAMMQERQTYFLH